MLKSDEFADSAGLGVLKNLLWAPLLNWRYNTANFFLQLYRRKSDTICRTDAHKSSHNEGIPTKNHNPSPPKQRCGQKRGGIRGKSDPKPPRCGQNWSTHGARTSAIHPCSGGEGLFYNKKSCEGGLAKNVEKDDEKT